MWWPQHPRTTDSRHHLAQTQVPLLDMVGKDTLKQLPALLERADLVMTPDSGPMHIANALGKKYWDYMQQVIHTAVAHIRTYVTA